MFGVVSTIRAHNITMTFYQERYIPRNISAMPICDQFTMWLPGGRIGEELGPIQAMKGVYYDTEMYREKYLNYSRQSHSISLEDIRDT